MHETDWKRLCKGLDVKKEASTSLPKLNVFRVYRRGMHSEYLQCKEQLGFLGGTPVRNYCTISPSLMIH